MSPGVSGPVLLVLAKAPVAGRVKTRLCPSVSPEQAARIAAAALLDTIDAVAATPAAVPVLALAGDLARAVDGWRIAQSLAGWTVLAQRGEALPDRLAAAHADAAQRFPGAAVLQIGMDTPQVTPGLLGDALARLAGGVPALLGPATDGGWWALGLRDPGHAEVLRKVKTSRPDTGERTVAGMRACGVRVERLPELSDVDTMADAVAVAAATPGGRFATAVAAVTPTAGVEARTAGEAPRDAGVVAPAGGADPGDGGSTSTVSAR